CSPSRQPVAPTRPTGGVPCGLDPLALACTAYRAPDRRDGRSRRLCHWSSGHPVWTLPGLKGVKRNFRTSGMSQLPPLTHLSLSLTLHRTQVASVGYTVFDTYGRLC